MASFRWFGFVEDLARWIESLQIPISGAADADVYVLGTNFSVHEVGLDVQGVDQLRSSPTLLTLFDEAGTMDPIGGRRIQQVRIVRLVRRGGSSKTALTELGRVFQVIVNRGRFTGSEFTGQLRSVPATPVLISRDQGGASLAQCVLGFIAYSRNERASP